MNYYFIFYFIFQKYLEIWFLCFYMPLSTDCLTYTWKQNKEGPRDLLKLSFNLLEARERERKKKKRRGEI